MPRNVAAQVGIAAASLQRVSKMRNFPAELDRIPLQGRFFIQREWQR